MKRILFMLLTAFALGLGSGCIHMVDSKPPGAWHESYQVIDDEETDAFIQKAIQQATATFGAPRVPINQVLVRRSKKIEAVEQYRIAENFSLTECVDPELGIFVIYLAVDPSHPNYYPLLGHECIHLLNPFIFDWYMEGIATVFSEEICLQENKSWATWKKRFSRAKNDPYARSYQMMKKIQQLAPEAYHSIPSYTAPTKIETLRIDIVAWLHTLPPAQRSAMEDIIRDHQKVLKKNKQENYHFTPVAK